jgi:hypothetical protein
MTPKLYSFENAAHQSDWGLRGALEIKVRSFLCIQIAQATATISESKALRRPLGTHAYAWQSTRKQSDQPESGPVHATHRDEGLWTKIHGRRPIAPWDGQLIQPLGSTGCRNCSNKYHDDVNAPPSNICPRALARWKSDNCWEPLVFQSSLAPSTEDCPHQQSCISWAGRL